MARAPSFDGCRTVSAVHHELIKLLSCDYLVESNDGARAFFIRSWEYLKTPKNKQKNKVEDVLEALRANGLFAEGNYEVLKELTRGIDDEIKHLITEAEEKIENIKKETTPLQKRTDIDRGLIVRIDALFDMRKKGEAVVLAVFQWTLDNSETTDVENVNNCSDFEHMVTDLITICCKSYPEEQLSSYGKKIFSSCIESAEKSFKAGREHFQQFKEHKLPVLKKYITTSGQNWRKTFSGFDAKATSVVCRCVYLDLNFTSVIGLERFWHYYTKRQFERDINNCFNSSTVMELLNVDRLDFTVCITDIEYRNYHEYLGPFRSDTTNFVVLTQGILGPRMKIMIDLLSAFCPPQQLPLFFKDYRMTKEQRQLIKDAPTSGYAHFNMGTLYIALRSISTNEEFNLTPTRGWGKSPMLHDKSPGDDIERIRIARNECVHSGTFNITDEAFKEKWELLKEVALRIGTMLGEDYLTELNKIEDYLLEEYEAGDFIAKMILKNADSLLNLCIRFFKKNTQKDKIPELEIPSSLHELMTARIKNQFF